MSVLVAVTDHAAERFRQRVGSRTGSVDVKPEIVERVMRAWEAGRVTDEPPAGASGARGSKYVRDMTDRAVIYVCRYDGSEAVVITLWEGDDGVGDPRVPRRFTNALKQDDHVVVDRKRDLPAASRVGRSRRFSGSPRSVRGVCAVQIVYVTI